MGDNDFTCEGDFSFSSVLISFLLFWPVFPFVFGSFCVIFSLFLFLLSFYGEALIYVDIKQREKNKNKKEKEEKGKKKRKRSQREKGKRKKQKEKVKHRKTFVLVFYLFIYFHLDINECFTDDWSRLNSNNTGRPCASQSQCMNLVGSFYCCENGYQSNQQKTACEGLLKNKRKKGRKKKAEKEVKEKEKEEKWKRGKKIPVAKKRKGKEEKEKKERRKKFCCPEKNNRKMNGTKEDGKNIK